MLDVEEEMKVVFVSAPPRIQLPRSLKKVPSLSSFTFNVLDWPAIEIARQMTLIEYGMYRRIEPKECLGNAFLKKDKATRAPHIVSMTRHFNDTSRWVIETILGETDLRKRRDTMRKFIEIADALRQINNYNGVNEVTSGLNNASIYRLKQTWALVPSQTKGKFDELDKLVQHPYTNLRKALQSSNPPCVPYVGVYLTDLTFIEEGNKDLMSGPSGELINLNKRRKVAKVLLDMRTYQQTPYHFEEVEALVHYIRSLSPHSDEELYQLSLRVEPRKPKKM
jgi:son of sevenless